MNTLGIALAFLFPQADPTRDFIVQDDGEGPYIKYWDETLLGPQPSSEQLTLAAEKALAVAAMRREEDQRPITQRHVRELTLILAQQAGQVTPGMIDPNQPLNEGAPAFLALSKGVRDCVLQERAIRIERAKL